MVLSEKIINNIIKLAEEAGKIIMLYHKAEFQIINKQDQSPVTTADLEAHKFIIRELPLICSDFEIISEEDTEHKKILGNKYWLIDPLDGTKNFIQGKDHFAVSIGLIDNNQPVFGVICMPALKLTYFTLNNQAFKKHANNQIEKISSKFNKKDSYNIVTSNSSDDKKIKEFLNKYKVRNHYIVSSALKLCMVAEAKANIYPCFTNTMTWDTAAGHAILRAAGGDVYLFDNHQNIPLLYDKDNFSNPHFLAIGSISD